MITFEPKDVVNPLAFKEFLASGGVEKVTIRMAHEGIILVFRIVGSDRILGQHRGGPRYFKTFDGAISSLVQYGIHQFEADVTGWLPRMMKERLNEN